MLKKIFLALVALFFIFIGSVWLLFKYIQSNPDVISQGMEKAIQHFTAGEPYEEKHEELLQEIQHILVRSQQSPIEVRLSQQSSLQMLYQGKVPKSESGPFITSQIEGVKMNVALREPISSHFFQLNINGENMKESDSELKAQIFLPQAYKGTLRIETQSAPVTILVPAGSLIQFDLQSAKGNVENLVPPPTGPLESTELTIIQVQTGSGNILIKPES